MNSGSPSRMRTCHWEWWSRRWQARHSMTQLCRAVSPPSSKLVMWWISHQDAGRAQRVAGRLRMGTVWINDYHPYVPQAEWGGYKQSGIGRELGSAGLDEYRETKHVWHNIRPVPQRWFGG